MLTPEELEALSREIEKLFYETKNRILMDVVDRIKLTQNITSTTDFLMEQLSRMGHSSDFLRSEIQRLTGMTDEVVERIYSEALQKSYVRNRALYTKAGVPFIPLEQNRILQSWNNAIMAHARNDIHNITRTMGFATHIGGTTRFATLTEFYRRTLDRAVIDITSGSFSYNQILERTVRELTGSGVRTIHFSQGRRGRSDRIEVASRRAVMTSMRQLIGRINDQLARELDTDHFEVSWHIGARPDHWWGGMVFSRADLVRACGLGEALGLLGINCYHNYTPFVEGASVRTYTDEELGEMNARERETTIWNGRHFNAYEATQQQRHFESAMRTQREQISFLRRGGADSDTIQQWKARYYLTRNKYLSFSERMGLPTHLERVYIDNFGRV